MVSQKVVIKNPTGLHLRPAGILCKDAMQFKSCLLYTSQKMWQAIRRPEEGILHRLHEEKTLFFPGKSGFCLSGRNPPVHVPF